MAGLISLPSGNCFSRSVSGECVHCTWLGFRSRTACGTEARAPPVADAGRRSVGNRKERAGPATMRGPRVEAAWMETAGRVGRCRIPKRNQPHRSGVDFFLERRCCQTLPLRLRLWKGRMHVTKGYCTGYAGIKRDRSGESRKDRDFLILL